MFHRRRMQPLSMGGLVMSIYIFNPPNHLASKEAVVVNVDFHHVLTIECQNIFEHKPMTLMFHMFDPKITIIGSPIAILLLHAIQDVSCLVPNLFIVWTQSTKEIADSFSLAAFKHSGIYLDLFLFEIHHIFFPPVLSTTHHNAQ